MLLLHGLPWNLVRKYMFPLGMNCNNFGDCLTFHVAPPTSTFFFPVLWFMTKNQQNWLTFAPFSTDKQFFLSSTTQRSLSSQVSTMKFPTVCTHLDFLDQPCVVQWYTLLHWKPIFNVPIKAVPSLNVVHAENIKQALQAALKLCSKNQWAQKHAQHAMSAIMNVRSADFLKCPSGTSIHPWCICNYHSQHCRELWSLSQIKLG